MHIQASHGTPAVSYSLIHGKSLFMVHVHANHGALWVSLIVTESHKFSHFGYFWELTKLLIRVEALLFDIKEDGAPMG